MRIRPALLGSAVVAVLAVSGCAATPTRPATLPPVNPNSAAVTPVATSASNLTTSYTPTPEQSDLTIAPTPSAPDAQPPDTTTTSTSAVVGTVNSEQPVASSSADQPADTSVPTSGEPTSGDPAAAGLVAPRLVADPADYSSPESVAVQYLSVWCFQSVQGPANSNISNAAPWLSKAGWDSDVASALSDQQWADFQTAGLSQFCDPAAAVLSLRGPVDGPTRLVEVTAAMHQVDANGVVVASGQIAQTRTVVQNSDGRWYVDVRVQAG